MFVIAIPSSVCYFRLENFTKIHRHAFNSEPYNYLRIDYLKLNQYISNEYDLNQYNLNQYFSINSLALNFPIFIKI